MSYQNVRPFFAGELQGQFQFIRFLSQRQRLRTGVTPRAAGAIVGTNARRALQPLLDQIPRERKISAARREYNGLSTSSRAVKVDPVPAKVNHFARRGGRRR